MFTMEGKTVSRSVVKKTTPYTPSGMDGVWRNGPGVIVPQSSWSYCEGMFAFSVAHTVSHPVGHFGLVDAE